MEPKFRCGCPFTSALDILGDKWMLVIIKQMLVEDAHTFKDFVESEEAIATNILATKLKALEHLEIISKTKLPHNKKTNIYLLTDRGLALAPLLVELANWSDNNLRDFHPGIQSDGGMELLRKDKATFTKLIVDNYKQKRATLH